MADSLFVSDRMFSLWLYTVSHSMLLLRSVKSASANTRIDLLFKGVRRLNLASTLQGVDLREVPISSLPVDASDAVDRIAFSLSGEKLENWIVCGMWAWHEDDAEYGDPSHFDLPKVVWDF